MSVHLLKSQILAKHPSWVGNWMGKSSLFGISYREQDWPGQLVEMYLEAYWEEFQKYGEVADRQKDSYKDGIRIGRIESLCQMAGRKKVYDYLLALSSFPDEDLGKWQTIYYRLVTEFGTNRDSIQADDPFDLRSLGRES